MSKLILLTGATGYVGGRLLTRRVQEGYRVRCLAREPNYLRGRISADVELARGDLLDAPLLAPPMENVDAGFYLVHSMESIESGNRLRLAAEMRMPGRAWLEFEVQPVPGGDGARTRQTATFDPLGLAGLVYWYGVWPLHQLVFAGTLKGLARRAETLSGSSTEP